MNIVEALLDALKAEGAHEVFGIPGDFILPFFKILEQRKTLPLYCFSHEPSVAYAADAAGRFNCKLGVVAVTYGAGALNTVNAVAQAYAERSPLVVISGAPSAMECAGYLTLHHQVKTTDSQFQLFKEITCAQVRLDNAQTAHEDIAYALSRCQENSQPVLIELPRDMAFAQCQAVPKLQPTPGNQQAAKECATEVLSLLAKAINPAILVGVEVRRYQLEDKVAELTRRLNLPVVTTFMGRGLLADTNAPVAGTYLGHAGKEEVTDLIENSDGLLLIGVIFSDCNFGVSKQSIDLRKAVVAHHRQVSISHHYYSDIPLIELIDELLNQIPDQTGTESLLKFPPTYYDYQLQADSSPITPMDISRGVNQLFRAHGPMPVASDVGDCLFAAMDIEPTPMVAPGYYASMGFGVPAGLGIQATTGKRPIILVGDGAFQMTGWELGHCQRFGFNPIIIVFNNQSWEMIRTFQPESQCCDLGDWHFADMVTTLGGWSIRVTTRKELQQALENAFHQADSFCLIEAMIPPGTQSPTLSRFAEGFQAARDQ